MFKTFVHINECGSHGWQYLPGLCAMSEQLTLWAPSGAMLQEAYDKQLTPYSPTDILDAINAGHIRIAGRENWLDGKAWRSRDLQPGEFYGRKWTDGFDDEIRTLAKTGKSSGPSNVLIAENERGWEWASEQIDQKTPEFYEARDLLASGQIPLGTAERISRQSGKTDEAIKVILRDSKNHYDAKRVACANVSLDATSQPLWLFNGLADKDPPYLPKTCTPLSRERIHEVAELLVELSKGAPKINIATIAENRKIQSEIYDLTCSEEQCRFELWQSINNGFKKEHTLMDILGSEHTYLAGIALITSFITLAYELSRNKNSNLGGMSRRDFLFTAGRVSAAGIGMASCLSAPATYLAKQTNRRPAGSDYAGPAFPYLLAYGTDSPTRAQIERMLAFLK